VIDQFHHPDDPNILILSNVKKDGQPTGLQDAGSYFHTDYSICRCRRGNDALFDRRAEGGRRHAVRQSAGSVRRSVGCHEKADRAALRIHHYGNRHDVDEQSRTAASPLTAEQKAKMPLITHKIARPHPITGRTSLYAVSGSSFGIVGMRDDEARDYSTSSPRTRQAPNTAMRSSTAWATSSSGTTRRCCTARR
jgi:taurine dioxygenase